MFRKSGNRFSEKNMRKLNNARITRGLSKAGPFLIVAALWEAATLLHLADPAFLPSIESILAALYELVRERTIFVELGASLVTAGSGLALGIVIGVPLGTAMALSPQADGFFGPLIKATYSLPKSALIPLFVLWFGVGGITNILATT